MTPADWNANQLADVLAKSAAAEDLSRIHAKKLVDDAQESLLHSAVVLGAVTYAANNAPETVQCTGGTTKTLLRRDSTSLPNHSASADRRQKLTRGCKRKKPPAACAASWVLSPAPHITRDSTWQQLKATAKRHCTQVRKSADAAALEQAVAAAANRLSSPAGLRDATERLAALW